MNIENRRVQVSVTLNGDLIDYFDEQAKKIGITRSRLFENCLAMAVDDLKLLRRLGMLDAVKVIQGFQAKVRRDLAKMSA